MKKVALSDATAHLSEFVDEVRTGGEPIVIHKRNKDLVVLVEIERFRRLQELEDRFRSLRLREALCGKTFTLRKVLAELNLGV